MDKPNIPILFKELVEYARLNDGVQVISKKKYYAFWKMLDVLLRILSFGQMTTFMTRFTTTLGPIIAFPLGWTPDKPNRYDYVTLRHELKHVKQYKKVGRGNIWLGAIIAGFAYLFLPFPVLFAWFRYKMERDAYRESYIAAKECGYEPNIRHYIDNLTGSSYLWTWYSKDNVAAWFNENCP